MEGDIEHMRDISTKSSKREQNSRENQQYMELENKQTRVLRWMHRLHRQEMYIQIYIYIQTQSIEMTVFFLYIIWGYLDNSTGIS